MAVVVCCIPHNDAKGFWTETEVFGLRTAAVQVIKDLFSDLSISKLPFPGTVTVALVRQISDAQPLQLKKTHDEPLQVVSSVRFHWVAKYWCALTSFFM